MEKERGSPASPFHRQGGKRSPGSRSSGDCGAAQRRRRAEETAALLTSYFMGCPVSSEKVGCLAHELFQIPEWGEHSIKPNVGLFQMPGSRTPTRPCLLSSKNSSSKNSEDTEKNRAENQDHLKSYHPGTDTAISLLYIAEIFFRHTYTHVDIDSYNFFIIWKWCIVHSFCSFLFLVTLHYGDLSKLFVSTDHFDPIVWITEHRDPHSIQPHSSC